MSVEFPDEDLLNLFTTYGELKSRSACHLFFTEEGLTHIENGIRVVQFNRIDRNIPRRVVLGGLEIGFKYSGQLVTCHRCHSTDHVVKNCPKRCQQPPPLPQQRVTRQGKAWTPRPHVSLHKMERRPMLQLLQTPLSALQRVKPTKTYARVAIKWDVKKRHTGRD